jgi:predicted nuclease with TOPRIM domain
VLKESGEKSGMGQWVSYLGVFLGGGFGKHLVDWLRYRQSDASRLRSELWNEIHALRARVNNLEYELKLGREERQRLVSENHSLQLRCQLLEHEVRQLREKAGLEVGLGPDR